MQSESECNTHVENNRQLLLKAAQTKQAPLCMEDINKFHAPLLLLDMMAEGFLDALKEGLFNMQDMANIYEGFSKFYTENLSARVPTGNPVHDKLSDSEWVNVLSEYAMIHLIRHMITEPYLNALRTKAYDLNDIYHHAVRWGLKAIHTLNPDLLEALEHQRIGIEDLYSMTYNQLDEAISANRYPLDPSYSYN